MAKRAVTVRLEGDKELKRKLDLLGRRARGALLKAAEAGAEVIENAAEQRAPGPHIVIGNQKVEGGRAEVDIGPDKEHWHYQFFETGATGHEISGSPLVFEGEAGLVVTKKVNHPGMPAEPFLRPALSDKREDAKDAAGRVFKAEIDQLVISDAD
jgi:HK97 gp10 family phage protein